MRKDAYWDEYNYNDIPIRDLQFYLWIRARELVIEDGRIVDIIVQEGE